LRLWGTLGHDFKCLNDCLHRVRWMSRVWLRIAPSELREGNQGATSDECYSWMMYLRLLFMCWKMNTFSRATSICSCSRVFLHWRRIPKMGRKLMFVVLRTNICPDEGIRW
jgi:hypothetical protein